jgi:signal recognition particle GTPase
MTMVLINQLVVFADRTAALIAAVGERASYRVLEFFTAQIRNPNTRRAYARAAVYHIRRPAKMSDEWKNDDWKKSLPQLRQARSDAQRAIENLAKASEALQLYMVVNESAQTNLARQEYLESIEKRLVKARYEITEIDRLIEQLEKAGSE